MKPYEKLTFSDDFLFCKILTEHPDLCKDMLEIIIDKKVGDFVSVDKQKPIEITADGKGVRFDVYIEDDTETVYDVEMQTTMQDDLAKRCRYYQGMIDLNTIQRGDRYQKLKNSYIIFILLHDPFSQGRSKYTFKNFCIEEPSLCLNDGTIKIFLNADGATNDITTELSEFLQYVAGKNPQGVLTNQLANCVTDARLHKKWREEYMTLQMKFQEREDLGIKKGIKRGLKQGRKEGNLQTLFDLVTSGILAISQAVDAGKKYGIQDEADFLKKAASAGYTFKKD